MDTETIDKLFLELSQFTQATTAKELALRAENERLKKERELLDKRIHNQRMQLRETWEIIEDRQRWRKTPLRTMWFEECLKLLAKNKVVKAENEKLRHGMKGDYDLDAWLEWFSAKQALTEGNGNDKEI